MTSGWAAVVLGLALTNGALAQGARQMTLSVDLMDAPRKLIHATERLPVAPGLLTLVYPKWIPGEHGPTGPIDNMAGFVIAGIGADGTEQLLKWQRDQVDMYAFQLVVPPGITELHIRMDFLATAGASGFSAGASTSDNLAVLSWNSVVVYPQGAKPAELMVSSSMTMPAAWQFGTALLRAQTATAAEVTAASSYTVAFQPVSLEQLVDSPVLAGRYFKEIPLAPDVSPKHYLDMAADGPEDLELPVDRVEEFSKLVREAGALYASHHYVEYHFLVTLSDSVAHFGLEHHQSSDDRVASRTFVEDTQFVLAGSLLPHEFTHSWNGKYRQPAGLVASDYQQPMAGALLWVYEGMTQYLGDVLAARAGLWTPDQYRGLLAYKAAQMSARPGRTWRDLQDTAVAAQVLYGAGGGWDNLRRGTDFYDEGELIWLDVDITLRTMSGGKKSLDDFVTAFVSTGGDGVPKVFPYTFADITSGLNAIVPNDWDAFLRQRLDSNAPTAPLGGIAHSGYRLSYESKPTAWIALEETQAGTIDPWFSLGLSVNAAGILTDVLQGGPAFKAGMGPGMRLVAVNGRAYTPALLHNAIHDAQGDGPPVEAIVENTGYFKVVTLDFHGGERYPVLEPVAGSADLLDEIVKPRAK